MADKKQKPVPEYDDGAFVRAGYGAVSGYHQPMTFDLGHYHAAEKVWGPSLDAWAYHGDCKPAADGSSPLAGVPFAVKDVIDVAGQPTQYGSDAFRDAVPALRDASVVSALRAAGACPVGKTRTTEFAFVDPTPTRNPYDLARSPGGSSSGSGAVVGAGIVPFALGTQTAGSLCRPATYCGAASYKPGLGVLPTTGMAPLSPSFDAIGIICQSAAWLGSVFDVLSSAFAIPGNDSTTGPLNIAFLDVPEQRPDPAMLAAMQHVIAQLRGSGHFVTTVTTPVSFPGIIDHHRTVMLREAANCLGPMLEARHDLLKPLFRAALLQGNAITDAQKDQALDWVENARRQFWSHVSAFDLILAYPVPGVAPLGLATTGDQSYLTPWTAMGGPLVSLPAGYDPDGLPLGILLAAKPGLDSFLVHSAEMLALLLPRHRPPTIPPHSNP